MCDLRLIGKRLPLLFCEVAFFNAWVLSTSAGVVSQCSGDWMSHDDDGEKIGVLPVSFVGWSSQLPCDHVEVFCNDWFAHWSLFRRESKVGLRCWGILGQHDRVSLGALGCTGS